MRDAAWGGEVQLFAPIGVVSAEIAFSRSTKFGFIARGGPIFRTALKTAHLLGKR